MTMQELSQQTHPESNRLPPTGRYIPVRFHARGGLGEVLVAQDCELGRHVALKRILGNRADDPQARDRFLREAEITGRLEHPGVVPVYGLGFDAHTGQPFYAMRFVTGHSMRQAIDAFHASGESYDSLGFRKLLGGFVSVCQTISYAHSRGVIHRDIKPSNIMLGAYGETLVVDWGLAKPVGETSDEVPIPEAWCDDSSTTHMPSPGDGQPVATKTSSSSSLLSSGPPVTKDTSTLGTPGYMSPEQADKIPAQPVGPATDIYALGATLYHILVGQVPLAENYPCIKMFLTVQGKVPPAHAVKPGVPVALSAICARAMAVNPQRRYRKTEDIAADVERYLADEPLSVLRENLTAKALRWVRKNPTTVGTTLAGVGVAAIAAVVGLSIVTGLNRQLEQARQTAIEGRDRAIAAEAEANRQRDIANRQRDRAAAAEASAAANFAEARGVLEQCLDIARKHPVFTRAGMQEARELLLSAAVPFHERFAVLDGSKEYQANAVWAKFQAALQSAQTKNKPEAIALFRRCVAELEELVAHDGVTVKYRDGLAGCYNNLALLLRETGQHAEARDAYRVAQRHYERLMTQYPDRADYRENLAAVHNNIAVLCLGLSALDEAQAAHNRAINLRRDLAEEFPDNTTYQANLADSWRNMAIMMRELGSLDAAVELIRKALAVHGELAAKMPNESAHAVALANCQQTLGLLLRERGEPVEAQTPLRAALEIYERLARANPAVVIHREALADTQNTLGLALRDASELTSAEASHRAALKIYQELAALNDNLAAYIEGLALTHNNLAATMSLSHRIAEAHTAYRTALALMEPLASKHPDVLVYKHRVAEIWANIADLQARSGQREEALASQDMAIKTAETALATHYHHPEIRQVACRLYCRRAELFNEQGHHDRAVADWRRALACTNAPGTQKVLREALAAAQAKAKSAAAKKP